MTRLCRRWLSACVAVAAVAIAACLLRPSAGALFERIRLGMTVAEVEALWGRPPDKVWPLGRGDGEVFEAAEPAELFTTARAFQKSQWWVQGNYRTIVAYRDGRVEAKILQRRVPVWELKAKIWWAWLRDLVGL